MMVDNAPENSWEDQSVVDLVGEVTAACCHNGNPSRFGLGRVDLWVRVGKCEDDGLFVHVLNPFGFENSTD